MVKTFISILVLGALVYLFFMVPLGKKTLWEHTKSIAQTSEAKEFGEEIGVAGKKLGKKIHHQFKEIQTETGNPIPNSQIPNTAPNTDRGGEGGKATP